MVLLSLLSRLSVPVAKASNVFTDNFCDITHPDACGAGAGLLANWLVPRVILFFQYIIGGAAVIAIVYGAFKLVSSSGNDQGKESAKNIIMMAVLGLILALAADPIIMFIVNIVEGIPGATI